MSRKRKKTAEFRYYRMPEKRTIIALLGEKWQQNYGRNIDYLHFHNFLEIGYCYEGRGSMILGTEEYLFRGGEFTVSRKIICIQRTASREISVRGNICLSMWNNC